MPAHQEASNVLYLKILLEMTSWVNDRTVSVQKKICIKFITLVLLFSCKGVLIIPSVSLGGPPQKGIVFF